MTSMQPQNLENRGGLEQLPVPPAQNGERVPILPSPEGGIETGAERREQTAEAQAAVADAAAVSQPATPVVNAQIPVAIPATPTTGPIVAADEDVIEKEWVDKAKQIITETKDDPYQRSNRVNELQKDYLKKRYGKDLGAAA
jgi:hypothetical protein